MTPSGPEAAAQPGEEGSGPAAKRGRRDVRIAVIPGDGIGQEVVPVAVEAVGLAAALEGCRLSFEEFPWGCAYYLREGVMMPSDGLEILRPYDAIFLGAIGDPRVVPDHVSLWGLLIAIRRGFHQSINVRPAKFLSGMRSPLRDPADFDFLIVRENSEGEYSQIGGTIHEPPDDMAVQVSVFTRRSVDRVVRYAFEAALGRRRHLISATKSNGIVHTMPFWDRIVEDVARDFPDVRVESCHLDALLARVVQAPNSLDVLVGSNLFGDLITDLSGALMGSIGMAPAANIAPDRSYPSMFEPVHGSAIDIAGLGIANPIGQLWTGALMLGHLGLQVAADRLFEAIAATTEAGPRTPDLGGTATTREVANAVLRFLRGTSVARG
jgi:tartrate dehydrogenase/decarboxylase/D-malate dehydrogenase